MGVAPGPGEMLAKMNAANGRLNDAVSSDPLWDFEIQNTGRKVGELIECVATLMRHGYSIEAQGIAHQAKALCFQLETTIRDRNPKPPETEPQS